MTNPIQPIVQSPAPTAAADTYTDLNGLASLKKNAGSPQAIAAVAQQVDALFMQMMLKSMRDASADVGEAQSNEMGMYQDMFDKQIALSLSKHQGLGLGAQLTRQLTAQAAASAKLGESKDAAAVKAGTPAGPGSQAPVRSTTVPHPPANDGAGTAKPGPTASSATPQSLLQDAIHFVTAVLPTIRRAADSVGVSPLGLLAQAALETGWGKRMPHTADGAPSLNLFGIKAGEHWTGPRANASTVEFSSGVATQRHSAFRAYHSIEASVSDFANLLQSSPRYREAVAGGANPQHYVDAIGGSGYATDPEYSDKLNEMLHSSVFRTALIVASSKL